MAQDNNENAVWFLAGAAVGAAVALLFAPQSGKETRALLASGAETGRDYLTEQGKDMMDRGRELYERGRGIAGEAADLFDRGKKLVEG